MNIKFVTEVYPIKKHNFKNEKETYNYIKKRLFKTSFKFFSSVLKGLPDFIVTELSETAPYELKRGFYEVKFKDRPLSKQQEFMLSELAKLTNCYIIRVYPDGLLQIYKVEN